MNGTDVTDAVFNDSDDGRSVRCGATGETLHVICKQVMVHTVPQVEIINVLSVFNETFWAEDRPLWNTELEFGPPYSSYRSGAALSAPPVGSGTEPQSKSISVHSGLKILTSGGNNFNDFPGNKLLQISSVFLKMDWTI